MNWDKVATKLIKELDNMTDADKAHYLDELLYMAVRHHSEVARLFYTTTTRECMNCHGTGKRSWPQRGGLPQVTPCGVCNASGRILN